MHLHDVIHCDLHLGNILLSNTSPEAIIKIVGFAHSQKISEIQEFDINSLNYEYISPEILEGKFDEKTDIWSAGVILYRLLVVKMPFVSKNKKEILEAIYKCDLDFNNPNFVALSHNARDLLQKLLVHDPINRYTAKDALSHIWLTQNSKDSGITYEVVQKLRRFKVLTI
jgi:calcium-dependent protein kinase